jgi:hypothetical protein
VSTLVPKVPEEPAPLFCKSPRKFVKNDWRAAVDWPEEDALDGGALDVLPPKSPINFVKAEFRFDSVPDDRFDVPVPPLTTWLFDRSFTSDCSAEMMPPCRYWAATLLAGVAGAVLVAAVVLLAVVLLTVVLPVAVLAAAAVSLSVVVEATPLLVAAAPLVRSPPPPPRSCRPVWRSAWNRSPKKDCRSCTTLLPFALPPEFAAAVPAVAAAVLAVVLAAVVPLVPAEDDCAAWVSACRRLANSAAPGCCAPLEAP